MSKLRLFRLALCSVLLLNSCTAVDVGRQMFQQTVQALRPSTDHYADPADATGDPWVQAAGAEARGDRPREQANDPFGLRNIFMSEKARDIERNMGFE